MILFYVIQILDKSTYQDNQRISPLIINLYTVINKAIPDENNPVSDNFPTINQISSIIKTTNVTDFYPIYKEVFNNPLFRPSKTIELRMSYDQETSSTNYEFHDMKYEIISKHSNISDLSFKFRFIDDIERPNKTNIDIKAFLIYRKDNKRESRQPKKKSIDRLLLNCFLTYIRGEYGDTIKKVRNNRVKLPVNTNVLIGEYVNKLISNTTKELSVDNNVTANLYKNSEGSDLYKNLLEESIDDIGSIENNKVNTISKTDVQDVSETSNDYTNEVEYVNDDFKNTDNEYIKQDGEDKKIDDVIVDYENDIIGSNSSLSTDNYQDSELDNKIRPMYGHKSNSNNDSIKENRQPPFKDTVIVNRNDVDEKKNNINTGNVKINFLDNIQTPIRTNKLVFIGVASGVVIFIIIFVLCSRAYNTRKKEDKEIKIILCGILV